MQPTAQEYQKLLTEIIQKLIVVFGPSIVLEKAKSLTELNIEPDGTVTGISSDPDQTARKMIDVLRELSSEAVDKIIEPLSANYPGIMAGGSKIHDTIEAIPDKAIPAAPLAAPIAVSGDVKKESMAIISAAPMPAPIPLQIEDMSDSNQNLNQLNIAGQGNG